MLNIMPTSDEKESGRETQITTRLCTSQIGRLTALCKKTIFPPLAFSEVESGFRLGNKRVGMDKTKDK